MIYSVTGTLVVTEPGAAVVDVGGVAFRCMTSMNTLRSLPRLSEKGSGLKSVPYIYFRRKAI